MATGCPQEAVCDETQPGPRPPLMNDAEQRFAERLGEDLDRVLGAGLAVDDIELSTADDRVRLVATLLVEGRIETIEVEGPDVLGLYRPLIERAAELRLRGAFWRMVGPT
jgi:hypothetical protein